MKTPPWITVGLMDRQTEVFGRLNGNFQEGRFGPLSGLFSAKTDTGIISLADKGRCEVIRSPRIRLRGHQDSTFTLFDVLIGDHFHWERRENQTFQGDLILQVRGDGTMAVVNEISLEDYLISVISSEMNAAAPMEFLKAHAILSRSWLLAALGRKKKSKETFSPEGKVTENKREIVRWYDRQDHDLFDVCAGDHCQRYQGVTKILSHKVEEAVQETHGMGIIYQNEICDARYSKCCGGITEIFNTAWESEGIPYLRSISDASIAHPAIKTEEEASAWILSEPEAYCNTKDGELLQKILPETDYETKDFFRWKVEYSREELEEILKEKAGIDFGTLKQILPLQRGPSGRICRLEIIGTKRRMMVGKELEIRRWLSQSHLYSSAFLVSMKGSLQGEIERFILHGAGWGHGVGLCQIGAAVMATQGFSVEQILKHYFMGAEIKKIY